MHSDFSLKTNIKSRCVQTMLFVSPILLMLIPGHEGSSLFFFFSFHLTYSRWTSSLPSCLWSQRIFPSLPGSRLIYFLSRCKLSTLTTRQPMVEFSLPTFPRFPLRKKEHKSYFGKNRTHDFRTSRCAAYLLDHSGDDFLSRCKSSALTPRHQWLDFTYIYIYIYTCTIHLLTLFSTDAIIKILLDKNRTHDFRTSRCAGHLLDHSGDE